MGAIYSFDENSVIVEIWYQEAAISIFYFIKDADPTNQICLTNTVELRQKR